MLQSAHHHNAFARTRMLRVLDQNVKGLFLGSMSPSRAALSATRGHLAAKLEASYDLLLTQRLILQPQIELNVYSKADPARMVGAGFADIDTGLRLRYEFSRKFASYLGVVYEEKFGQTANFARRAGESTGGVRFVAGLRLWF